MSAATHAVIFGTRQDQPVILLGGEVAGDQREEAGPSGPAVEFHRRSEERQRAAGAYEHARSLLVVERAREWALGILVPQHQETRAVEHLLPFGFGLGERVGGQRDLGAGSEQRFPVLLELRDRNGRPGRGEDPRNGPRDRARWQEGEKTAATHSLHLLVG